jgi:hypothetical protein
MRPIFKKEIFRAAKGHYTTAHTPEEDKEVGFWKMQPQDLVIFRNRGRPVNPPFCPSACVNTV